MTTETGTGAEGAVLLQMRGLKIEGQADDQWHEIVHGIDLDLRRGEALGLIGESGAGKSTIGIAAMGFARPGCRITGGSIIFDGIDLRAAGEEEKRKLRGARIAYVAQSAAASFNPAHKLIDQYSEMPVQHGVMRRAEAEAKDLCRRLQLPEPETIGFRYPHQVSGGQLQRAMTAMAMSCRPDLIVFDEPTTALDVTTQIEVLAAIKDVVRELNTAAIYIAHDLAVVAQMADRIMVPQYGHLVEEGNAREMIAAPKEEYTRRLLAVRSFRKEGQVEIDQDKPLLRVENLAASYGGMVRVLKNIDMEIHKARTVAVVGESGSGKSTLARAITGLLLEFYLGMRGLDREERVREPLTMIELEPDEFIDRPPGELSGGQKQRICIARALAAEPELIICDAVTSALDQLVAEEILKLPQRLQDELQVSYMFITHDLATARAISDEIVVMLRGEIVEQGEKQQVLSPPHHEYTELLLSSVPEMDPDWLDNLLAKRAAAS